MTVAAVSNLPTELSAVAEPIYLHLPVTDPETVAVLSEVSDGRDRQELALTALKIGILSLKAARGTVDGAAIRQEGDRLIGSLEERLYTSTSIASFSTRRSAAR